MTRCAYVRGVIGAQLCTVDAQLRGFATQVRQRPGPASKNVYSLGEYTFLHLAYSDCAAVINARL